jgi:carboxypeptidase Q
MKISILAGWVFAACALATGAAFSAPTAAVQPGSSPAAGLSLATLAGEVYANGRSLEYLRELSDELGPRLSGTAGYERAALWAAQQFRLMGIGDVHTEPVRLAHGWERGPAAAQLLGERPRDLHVTSYGWSPATPAGGLKGPVAVLEDTTDAAIEAAHVRGHLVLIDRQAFTGPRAFRHASTEEWDRQRRYETLHQRLAQAGAMALLVHTDRPNQVLRTSAPTDGGELLALPVASIGMEDALLIRRLLGAGAVELSLRLENRISGPVTLENVIAQIRGREFPDEAVMLGAHLDSWDLGTGAQDNGSGVAQVMDVARAFASRRVAPRRTLRIALWASEEQGLNGSIAHVRAQGAGMRQVVAYLNTDTGAGRPKGWNVGGREDVAKALQPLAPLLARIGGAATTDDLTFDTDTGPFTVAGVASLNLDVDDSEYDSVVHHKPADTFDKVDAHFLSDGAAMLAVTAAFFAEAPQRPLKRLDWNEMQQILERNGARDFVLTSKMKDLWRD